MVSGWDLVLDHVVWNMPPAFGMHGRGGIADGDFWNYALYQLTWTTMIL